MRRGGTYDPFNYTVGNTWDTTWPSRRRHEILPRLQDVSVHRQLAEVRGVHDRVSDCSTATLWSSFYAKSRLGAKAAIVRL